MPNATRKPFQKSLKKSLFIYYGQILSGFNFIQQAKEYSLDKEQTSYNDLFDGLRLSLKGYNII